jgi:hypothetical protein
MKVVLQDLRDFTQPAAHQNGTWIPRLFWTLNSEIGASLTHDVTIYMHIAKQSEIATSYLHEICQSLDYNKHEPYQRPQPTTSLPC